jgi:hypothetical protein
VGDDDLKICTACGRAVHDHALSLREDGVVTAVSIPEPVSADSDWIVCAETAARADAEIYEHTIARLKREYGEDD